MNYLFILYKYYIIIYIALTEFKLQYYYTHKLVFLIAFRFETLNF